MLVANKLNREQVMLGLNAGEEKNVTASAEAGKNPPSAMSKGAPPAKQAASLIESPTQSMEVNSMD